MGESKYSVFLINLDRDVDRLRWMDEQLKNIDYERLPAVFGKNLISTQKKYYESAGRSKLGQGEIGCLLSHIEAWKKIADRDEDFGVILEDDVHIGGDFKGFLCDFLKKIDFSELSIHKLETVYARVTLERAYSFNSNGRRCYELLSVHCGGGAYAISNETAKALLSFLDVLNHPVDIELFDPERSSIQGIKVYQWDPAPCVQDLFINGESRFKSNISGSRYDESTSLSKNQSNWRAGVKNIFRPAYTRLYSFILWFIGKKRMLIKFK